MLDPANVPGRMRHASIIALVAVLAAACAGDPRPATPVPAPAEPDLALACWSVPAPDCVRVAAMAVARRPAGRPIVVVAEVREGSIDIEYAEGGGRDVAQYRVTGDGELEFAPWSESQVGGIQPESGLAPGPVVPISLGHCGLSSPIDLDGAFWDPYGQIDANVAAFINASDGQFRRLGANEAEFVTGGSRVSLRRHVGAKSPPGCD